MPESHRKRGPDVPAAPMRSSRPPNASACQSAIERIMLLAHRISEDTAETRSALPSGRSSMPEGIAETTREVAQQVLREELKTAFDQLEPELALKLRTLLIAGRDRRSIDTVNANVSMSDADAAFAKMAVDSMENGPLLIDYLQRGHALACATGVDLDGPFAAWRSTAEGLDARAWLSFGKQLANSLPSDWECLGVVDAETGDLSKLYLRLGDNAWWSFQAVIDRPTLASVAKDRRELGRRRSKGMSTHSLQALVRHFDSSPGRALRRAAKAIRARVGHTQKESRPAAR